MRIGARGRLGAVVVGLCLALFSSTAGAGLQAWVLDVVDGDTIVLKGGERVRYRDIDAPEVPGADGPGMPFGPEAARRNRELVQKRFVRLEVDRADLRDRYGRLLARVFLHDGRSVAGILVGEGLAWVCPGVRGAGADRDLLATQGRAIEARRGIWSLRTVAVEPYYIGNRGSFRFHRPHCPSAREIARGNRVIFQTRLQAFSQGYCGCRRCQP